MQDQNSARYKGEYVNGIYQSANGFPASGLNCPKGTKLYDESVIPAIYYQPDDMQNGEIFEMLNPDIAPEAIKNCYAVSNYGRVLNIRSEKIIKPEAPEGGYRRVSLTTRGEKPRKYSVHRLVLGTFHPVENMDELQVNHKNMVKSDNYVDKPKDDGSLESNLEWCTGSENVRHMRINTSKLTFERASELRKQHDSGMSYSVLKDQNPDLGYNTIKYACENRTFVDPNYVKPPSVVIATAKKTGPKGITPDDVQTIRKLYNSGLFTQIEIQSKFYPQITVGTISNIVTRKTYANIP